METRKRLNPERFVLLLLTALPSESLAVAQVTAPECEQCEDFVPRYHPREIVLIARSREGLPPILKNLWYAQDVLNGLGVLSWNQSGAVVGTRFDPLGTTPRPFLWTPAPIVGSGLLPGTYDLLELAHGAASIGVPGFAWDISDDFMIVGGAGGLVEPDPVVADAVRARAWDATKLPSSCAFEFDLDPAPPESPPWSMALAIEPVADPPNEPRIVGVGGQECDKWREPFQFQLNLPNCIGLNCAVIELAVGFEPPHDPWLPMAYIQSEREWACDITNHFDPVGTFDSPRGVVTDALSECTGNIPSPGACYEPMQAGALLSSTTRLYRLGIAGAPDAIERTGVRSITSFLVEIDWHAKVAGYCWSEPIPGATTSVVSGDCRQNAAVWNYDQFDLPYAVLPRERPAAPDVVDAKYPIAQRWRPIECICQGEVVLGWDGDHGDTQLGRFWTKSRVTNDFELFEAEELLAVRSPTGVSVTVTEILQLYDITSTGEILALVKRTYGALERFDVFAAILGLQGDMNGDHLIDSADLAILLSSWDQGDVIAPDLNINGMVDATDLTVLLDLMSSPPQRLLLPGDALLGSSYCMQNPGELCWAEAVDLATDETRREQCLYCALECFGFISSAQFTEWTRVADADLLDATCNCIGAVIRHLMEEES